jgi:hypothetical protein
MTNITKLVNFAGLKLTLETDKEAMQQNVAEAVGSRAYAAAYHLTGKGWDDTVQAKQAVQSAPSKVISLGRSARDSAAANTLSEAINEVADASNRIVQATGDRALKSVDARVTQPIKSQIRSVQRYGQELKIEAGKLVDQYCDDVQPEPKALPPSTGAETLAEMITAEIIG